jgi:Cof subfamily protein (haloacid dehalogenase superfamily)
MTLRAICTDIDGTLLNSRRELSERTISTIRNLVNTPVILASSRMPAAMRHLQEELGILHQPLICYNGGYVIYYEGNAPDPVILDSVQIPAAVCTAIAELAQHTTIHISIYQEDNWFAPRQDEWTAREINNTKVVPTIQDLALTLLQLHAAEKGAHKVMCMGPEDEILTLANALDEQYGTQLFVYRSKSTYLEIAPRSISKATALELLLKQRFTMGIDQVMAFGDNYNDIDMLAAVGMGIAVGNARDEAKAVAREVTLKSTDDGVAAAIEKYFAQA